MKPSATAPPASAEIGWTIHPHGSLTRLEDNLKIVTGDIPGLPFRLRRVMTVAKLSDGRLVFHSVIALGPSAMAELEAWGEPAFVVVPSGYHRIDAPAYKRRYPKIQVVCPAKARGRVEERVQVDGGFELLPADPAIEAQQLDGAYEGVLGVRSGDRYQRLTLVFNDTFFNQSPIPGIAGRIYGLLGSTGGPRVPPIVRWSQVSDRAALRAHLERLASRPELVRLVPGHGEPIDVWPGKTLARAAAEL